MGVFAKALSTTAGAVSALGPGAPIHSADGGGFRLLRTGGEIDYRREVGTGGDSSIVDGAVNWAARSWPGAHLTVEHAARGSNEWEVQPDHPMLEMLEMGTLDQGGYGPDVLWQAALADYMVTGNAYLLKVRPPQAPAAPPVAVWWLPSQLVEPVGDREGREYLTAYLYRVGGVTYGIEPRDVVHFRWGLDPENPRLGRSPLRNVLREVFTDEEAAAFAATILRNLGVPGIVVAPAKGSEGRKGSADETKERLKESFGGKRRGEPIVFTQPTDISVLSWSPEQMSLRDMRRIPEERITGVLGIPAIVAGMGAGLDRSTFANYAEAREAATEDFLVPTWRAFAAVLSRSLLRDWQARGDAGRWRARYDTTEVRVLQEDRNAMAERIRGDVAAGILSVAAAQRMLGYDPDDAQEVYLRPFTALEVPVGQRAPQIDEGTKGYEAKALTAAEQRIAQQIERVRTGLLVPARRRIAAAFGELADAAVAKVAAEEGKAAGVQVKADPDAMLPDVEALIGRAVTQTYTEAAEAAFGVADGVFDVALAWDVTLPEVQRALAGSAEQVQRVSDQTRKVLRDYIEANVPRIGQPGYDREDFKRGVRGIVEEYYTGRSEAIARTELRRGTNAGAVARYRAANVTMVRAVDGDEDGLCAARNGRTYTLGQALLEDGNEHPNGTLSFVPVLG